MKNVTIFKRHKFLPLYKRLFFNKVNLVHKLISASSILLLFKYNEKHSKRSHMLHMLKNRIDLCKTNIGTQRSAVKRSSTQTNNTTNPYTYKSQLLERYLSTAYSSP